MNNPTTLKQRPMRRLPAAALLGAALVVSTAPALARPIAVPANLPPSLRVLPPDHPFLIGQATGTQNYICLPAVFDGAGNPTAFAWKLFTPEATLFNEDADDPKQLITHFFSPNPDELNTDPLTDFHPIRATWQSSRDSSSVWARTLVAGDSVVVDDSAVAWLKLTAVGHREGPAGGDLLNAVTFVQRVNTTGGIAPPAETCDSLKKVGTQAFRPYTADYIFYTDQ